MKYYVLYWKRKNSPLSLDLPECQTWWRHTHRRAALRSTRRACGRSLAACTRAARSCPELSHRTLRSGTGSCTCTLQQFQLTIEAPRITVKIVLRCGISSSFEEVWLLFCWRWSALFSTYLIFQFKRCLRASPSYVI